MSTPILTTKLYIPLARAKLISRPHLITQLNEGLGGKVILISAPAGFGKTTLVSDWLQQIDLSVAWLSLDEGDNDPLRFFSYLIAAFQQSEATIGQTLQNILRSPQLPPSESIMTALVNDLAASATELILVLDDYHLIEAKPIHDALNFLLDYMPPALHLIITSRLIPPLSLARLRVRHQMVEINAADLRFTADEASLFLKQVMGLTLSEQNTADIAERTEGWVAGLQLAALSAQGRVEAVTYIKDDFIKAFTGSQGYVMDYLAEEVLQQQPQNVQDFLLKTSVLDRLTASLCDVVTGKGDAEQMLDWLKRNNLFIVALDGAHHWYRYHHLFSEFLYKQLEYQSGEMLPGLHRRAGQWYADNNLIDEALKHALTGRNFDQAADILEQNWWPFTREGRHSALLHWFSLLPESLFEAHPQLCVIHALPLWLAENLDLAEQRLQLAEANNHQAEFTPTDLVKPIQSHIDGVRGLLIHRTGAVEDALSLYLQALDAMPENDSYMRCVVMAHVADIHLKQGQLNLAEEAHSEAYQLAQQVDHPMVKVRTTRVLSDIALLRGQLHQAAAHCRQTIQAVEKENAQWMIQESLAYISLGTLNYEWNDLDTAANYLQQGILKAEALSLPNFTNIVALRSLLVGTLEISRLKWIRGDEVAAFEYLRLAEQIVQDTATRTKGQDRLVKLKVFLLLAQGKIDDAANLVQSGSADPNPFEFGYKIQELTAVRVLIAQGNSDEAIAMLAPIRKDTEEAGLIGVLIELLILQALALHAQGKMQPAITTLKKALNYAEPENYIRLFVDEGRPMAQLLRTVQASGIHSKYMARLLAAFGDPYYPLTEREFEILQLLAQNLSNQEIAATLVISVNTVKTHIKHIYEKLDVNNRVGLIEQAHHLNLLS